METNEIKEGEKLCGNCNRSFNYGLYLQDGKEVEEEICPNCVEDLGRKDEESLDDDS